TIYAKSLYNLGGTYSRLGNFEEHKNLTIKSIDSGIKVYGPDSPELILSYASLITAYIELKNYTKALELTDTAYRIADLNEENADPGDIAFLYGNLGVLFNSIGDYSRSRVFLEKAEFFYNKAGSYYMDAHVSILNSLVYSLKNLNEPELADQYYNKGVKLAMNSYSLGSYQVLRVYAGNLAREGRKKEGETVLKDLLSRIIARDGINSQGYYEVLTFYADFLHEFKIDDNRALEMYLNCIGYMETQDDSFLKYYTKLGCALILSERQQYTKSLELLQSLLFPKENLQEGIGILSNPDVMLLNPDKDLLDVLQTKYLILKKFNHDFPDQKVLEASSKTSELIIALLDRIRINISEEESRLLLGDRYRNSYILVISDFYSLYKQTGHKYYLDKAFEYTEKSKIAGLLTATRELKATEFHIPEDLADIERELQSEIALLNDRITGKYNVENKTEELIQTWKDNLLKKKKKRDSLLKVFERDYPGYYSIKYNTDVLDPSMVPEVAGNKTNYISYIVSDTNLYITILNKKYHELVSVSVDSGFFQKIREFRRMLSAPDFNDEREDYINFQKTGYDLFSVLIAPVEDYLISERILISPDNILSYLPFETLPIKNNSKSNLSYKEITFMMEEYDISYAYSATFLAENLRQKKSNGSKVIAFAPDYSDPVNIQDIYQKRQQHGNVLYDLPYARMEAEYVSKIFGGKLLINESARESEFKKEAPDFDIIHLAMHTVLDDNNPMRSTLIFSPDTTKTEDRFLMTYEIYNIPLKARMVVLSSCNTGTGKL
ncbi:MAG: CHAT domain-containing protein, partial [Bacteroidia bacterium]|nr:CHAT domain-containing protein [Bacteroidia bacterium]